MTKNVSNGYRPAPTGNIEAPAPGKTAQAAVDDRSYTGGGLCIRISRRLMEYKLRLLKKVKAGFRVPLILALTLPIAPLSFAAEPYSEPELKAAYIFNFLKFVEWPGESATESIQVCAFSEDLLLPYLKQLEKRTVRNKSINLVVYDSEGDISDCQLIYLNAVPPGKRRSIIKAVASKPVLTVGNEGRYADDDEIITFFTEEKKLRFDINFRQVRESGIEMSSRLLKLARISER